MPPGKAQTAATPTQGSARRKKRLAAALGIKALHCPALLTTKWVAEYQAQPRAQAGQRIVRWVPAPPQDNTGPETRLVPKLFAAATSESCVCPLAAFASTCLLTVRHRRPPGHQGPLFPLPGAGGTRPAQTDEPKAEAPPPPSQPSPQPGSSTNPRCLGPAVVDHRHPSMGGIGPDGWFYCITGPSQEPSRNACGLKWPPPLPTVRQRKIPGWHLAKIG